VQNVGFTNKLAFVRYSLVNYWISPPYIYVMWRLIGSWEGGGKKRREEESRRMRKVCVEARRCMC